MTLQEAAYNLLNLLRRGRSTNSEEVSIEQIKFNILYYRALLLRRDAERGTNLSPFEQTLPVEIDLVSPVFPEPTGSLFQNQFFDGTSLSLARSVRPLPYPIRLQTGEAISYVGHAGGGGAFSLIHPAAAAAMMESRYTSAYKRAFFSSGYLYLLNPSLDTGEVEVSVRGVFEDPRAAHNFAAAERAAIDNTSVAMGDYFDDDTTPFPCSLDLYQRITQALLSGEHRLIQSEEPDISLNQ